MLQSVSAPRLAQPGRLFYYRCRKRNRDGAEAYSHRKCHRADQVEPRVWDGERFAPQGATGSGVPQTPEPHHS